MTTDSSFDTIVVGGGIAGLVAATQLARAHRRVLLLERRTALGGRGRTDDLGGWLFNQGAHALYNGGIGHQLLQKMGIKPEGEMAPLEGAQLSLGGQTTLLPRGAKTLARTKALSAIGKLQFGRLMAGLAKLDPLEFSNVSVDEWLSPYRDDVGAIVKALVRLSTYASAADLMSAEAAIAQLQAVGDGVLYLHGGWAQLSTRLREAATDAGAQVITGAKVRRIGRQAEELTVATPDATYRVASVVVAAGGPDLTSSLLGIDRTVFGNVGPAPTAAVLDLALDEMPAKHRFILGIDEPTYFSVQSPPAQMAPDGKVAAVAMRYLDPDDQGSASSHRESLEALANLAGIGTPVRTRFLRRMVVANGLPIASGGGLAGRPRIAVPGHPGVFVAGDWVGDRGLLVDGSIASAIEAATAASLVPASVQ